ncbi:MAG: SIR2 family protein [Helicobacteraceae bacterium]|nr:SIR2 family protein [Helicobacteraceae bacterium]
MKLTDFQNDIAAGRVAPYLGLEIFKNAVDSSGVKLPSSGEEIILALNGARAMSPRLMFEYSRAAMAIEQRKGRKALETLFANIYKNGFEPLAVHKKIASLNPRVIVDTNRDAALQSALKGDFTLVCGRARIAGDQPRFEAFVKTGDYQPIEPSEVNLDKPLLFKPLGVLEPKPQLILSDADFVDWLTEAIAGMAAPVAFKQARADIKWLFLGCNFERDTDRMVASEIIGGENSGGGWHITEKPPSRAERRFLTRHKIEIIPASLEAFIL